MARLSRRKPRLCHDVPAFSALPNLSTALRTARRLDELATWSLARRTVSAARTTDSTEAEKPDRMARKAAFSLGRSTASSSAKWNCSGTVYVDTSKSGAACSRRSVDTSSSVGARARTVRHASSSSAKGAVPSSRAVAISSTVSRLKRARRMPISTSRCVVYTRLATTTDGSSSPPPSAPNSLPVRLANTSSRSATSKASSPRASPPSSSPQMVAMIADDGSLFQCSTLVREVAPGPPSDGGKGGGGGAPGGGGGGGGAPLPPAAPKSGAGGGVGMVASAAVADDEADDESAGVPGVDGSPGVDVGVAAGVLLASAVMSAAVGVGPGLDARAVSCAVSSVDSSDSVGASPCATCRVARRNVATRRFRSSSLPMSAASKARPFGSRRMVTSRVPVVKTAPRGRSSKREKMRPTSGSSARASGMPRANEVCVNFCMVVSAVRASTEPWMKLPRRPKDVSSSSSSSSPSPSSPS
mmetsp:Transcript_11476/g.36483  ORF Transcript_11476/g.36483 Transcript_11476/m.36483 type:complete len:471 (+) Transcript_11476:238-1650(+)